MNAEPLPIPSTTVLRNISLSKRKSSGPSSVVGGVPWDWTNYFGPSSIENVSTAQSEYFWLKTGGIPGGSSFCQTSPSVVKSADDVAWFTSRGYPAPPMGAVLRGVDPDGNIGSDNYLEITPVGWYINIALELGDVSTATKLFEFAQWMTFDASLYGYPVKLVAGIAKPEGGEWVKKTDRVLLRNQALVAWGAYKLFQRTADSSYRNYAKSLLDAIALAINNIDARISREELPPFMEGALYHSYTSLGTSDGVGPKYAFTRDRWTIEHLLGVVFLLEVAREVEGANTPLVDPEGTSYTIESLLQKVGKWVDTFFQKRWVMRRGNPRAPYMPYQFVIQQASYNADEYYKGVNFDWTKEGGITFGDTWWVGDLELWGIIGMLRLKKLGYVNGPVERFLWDWLRLPGPDNYTWYNRYQLNGEPLEHDKSSPIVFTALYGLALLEGYRPLQPPPKFSARVQGSSVTITPEYPEEKYAVRDSQGQLLGVYVGEATITPQRRAILYIEEL